MSTTTSFLCPNCNAGLIFDPDKQKLVCEFCLSEFTEEEISKTDAQERAQKAKEDEEEFCSHMNTYVCENCGAEVIADETTAADFCYYCHNPIVLTGKLSGQMKPDKIVPFKYGKKEAEEAFLKYAKKKWFVPRDFFSADQAEKISGIYFPFWVTDADTDSSSDGTAKRIRVWRSGDTEYKEISNFRIHRKGFIHFEDIVTYALSEGDKEMLEGILPFPSESLIDFSMPYLQGYTAKKRNIERDSLSGEVREKMCRYAHQLLSATVHGYSSVDMGAAHVNILCSHWEYALMPIWVLTYKKKNKTYIYAMNGHTGKVYGKLPISYAKLGLFGAGLTAILSVLFSLIGAFFF